MQLTALLVLAGSLLAVALWEFCQPRRQREFPALRRRLGNIGIWLLNIVLVAVTFAPTDTFRPQLESVLGVALPSWPIANRWASFAAAFLLLDFLNYATHRCQHAVPLLWRLHALHHSDPDVDVTTSVRHHPIEYLLAGGFYWLAVLAFDLPLAVVTVHGLTVFATAAITHGNTRCPEWLERLLQPLVITTRPAPRPPLGFAGPGERQFRRRAVGVGSAVRNLCPIEPGAARGHRLWRRRTAAPRIV